MAVTRRKPRLTLQEILEDVQALTPQEQNQLRTELAKISRVYVMEPDTSPAAIRRGRQLAEEIRKEVNASMKGTLEDTMLKLRGLSWS